MAHPKETREKLRRLYVSDGQTLEIAAMMCEIPKAMRCVSYLAMCRFRGANGL